ncbi:3-ketoacyl-CoA thiolase, mitochondrial [Nymphon striatum]|nr:3-ketoacyl-CoA thiolase, mitochondrial [Nymphon striatum]
MEHLRVMPILDCGVRNRTQIAHHGGVLTEKHCSQSGGHSLQLAINPCASKESWGYISVRPGAKMFYWLYFANMTNNAYTSRPLVVWLQGGPGVSSTGLGNFLEIGPLDLTLKSRNTTWVKDASILFVDSPVGTGFSYVKNKTLLCQTDEEIGKDLLVFLKEFMSKLPDFQVRIYYFYMSPFPSRSIPVYIFSESYGAKMAVHFSYQLLEAMKAKTVAVSFKGLILGSPWISPLDSVASWSSFLYSMSYIGADEVNKLDLSIADVTKEMTAENYTQAFENLKKTQILVLNLTSGISFDNIQYQIKAKNESKLLELFKDVEENSLFNFREYDEKKLYKLMNTIVREKLAYIDKDVIWGGQKKDVFDSMKGSFMKPANKLVELMLNSSSIPIIVYNGQFDLTANSLGVLDWMHNLNWPGQDQFKKKSRQPVFTSKGLSIFHKCFKNLHYYSVLKAGKMVPFDNPEVGVFVVAAKRTAFGTYGGKLKSFSPTDLAEISSKGALAASGVAPENIDSVVVGNCIPAAPDTIYISRHTALRCGMPVKVPALTINRLCGSGFQAIINGAQEICLRDSEIVMCAGTESMSCAPYFVNNIRFGTKLGEDPKFIDALWHGLTDSHIKTPMAVTAENLAEKYGISRQECDEYALQSQLRWKKAQDNGRFKDEIVPITLKVKGKQVVVDFDEHPRPATTMESLSKLPAVFKKNGTVTAGNASGICDGAATVIIASEDAVKKHDLTPLARIVGYNSVGCDPSIMGIGPAPAIRNVLEQTGIKQSEIDIFDINEAFASQFLAVQKELGLDPAKTNVNGGAIALGHPLAASGTRITANLVHEMKSRSAKYAVGSACIGGGQGIALLMENIK